MRSKSSQAELDWQGIEKAYLAGKHSVAHICQQFGLKPHQLYSKAKTSGWEMRSKTKSKKRPQKAGQEKKTPSKPIGLGATKGASVCALHETLEFITMDLMQRISDRRQDTSADHEKDARTLSSLVRTYEKLKTIAAKNDATSIKEPGDHTTSDQSAQQRRAEIAARLEKLVKGL